MNESIKDYVEKNYILEMQAVLFKVFSLLNRLNIFTYEAYILNILNELDNVDTEYTSTDIVNYLEGFIITLENEFGYILNDQVTLEQRTDFMRGYVDLEDYIDHEAVIRVLETDNDLPEKLSEVVSLTTVLNKETLLCFIDTVDESALFTLSRLHISESSKENIINETDSPVASPEQIKNVKAYDNFIKENNLTITCINLVREGYEIGLPWNIYWDKVSEDTLKLGRDELCIEFIGLCLLSKEFWTNPQTAFNDFGEKYLDSLSTFTEANQMIKNIMSSFLNYKSMKGIK